MLKRFRLGMLNKSIWITLGYLIFAGGVGGTAGAANHAKPLKDYCLEIFLEKGVCPEKVCEFRCSQESPGCAKFCLPKGCTQIKFKDCPLEYCQVMTDCSDQKICHYKMEGETPSCGDLAYAGQDVECCDGLTKRCGVEFIDGRCDMEGKNSIYNLPICIPCGDGICGQFEDRCNCPEDCRGNLTSPSIKYPKSVVKQKILTPATKGKTESSSPLSIEPIAP